MVEGKTPLDVFKENENWKSIRDTFVSLWTRYFELETDCEVGSWVSELCIEDEGVCIEFRRTGDTQRIIQSYRVVTTRLCIHDVSMRRVLFWKRRVSHMVINLSHDVRISRDSFNTEYPKHCWRTKKDRWKVRNADFGRLGSIPHAIKLLHARIGVAGEEKEAHQIELEVLDEYLDGMAEVFGGVSAAKLPEPRGGRE